MIVCEIGAAMMECEVKEERAIKADFTGVHNSLSSEILFAPDVHAFVRWACLLDGKNAHISYIHTHFIPCTSTDDEVFSVREPSW